MTLHLRCADESGAARDETLSGQTAMTANARRVRPDFQLVAGTEYMVSAGANGATGMISALAGVAPVLVRRLFEMRAPPSRSAFASNPLNIFQPLGEP